LWVSLNNVTFRKKLSIGLFRPSFICIPAAYDYATNQNPKSKNAENRNQDEFFDAFKVSFQKLQELGVADSLMDPIIW